MESDANSEREHVHEGAGLVEERTAGRISKIYLRVRE